MFQTFGCSGCFVGVGQVIKSLRCCVARHLFGGGVRPGFSRSNVCVSITRWGNFDRYGLYCFIYNVCLCVLWGACEPVGFRYPDTTGGGIILWFALTTLCFRMSSYIFI